MTSTNNILAVAWSGFKSWLGKGSVTTDGPIGWTGAGKGNATGRVDDAYGKVAPLFRCVSAKADAVSSLPLRISTGQDEVIESGPLADLAMRPNPLQSGPAFWRATSAFVDLFGHAPWVFTLDSSGRVLEVMCVNPLQLTAEIVDGKAVAWLYTPVGTARVLRLAAEEVHWVVNPNYQRADYPWIGLAAIEPAAMAIRQHYKADVANESSLDNGVVPDGIITTAPGVILGEEQRKLFREQLMERHGGPTNRRKWLIGEGGLKYETMAATFADMEFSQLKNMSRDDICAALNVPPAVAGYYSDSNYAHAESADKTFWTGCIVPRVEWFAQEWTNAILTRQTRDNRSLTLRDSLASARKLTRHQLTKVYVLARKASATTMQLFAWFDTAGVPALDKAFLDEVNAAIPLIDKGISTVNEMIEARDWPLEAKPWGDTWWRPFGLVDVQDESTMPGANDPPGNPIDPIDPDDDDDDSDASAVPAGDGDDKPSSGGGKALREFRGWHTQNKARIDRIQLSLRATWEPLQNQAEAKIRRVMMDQRAQTLRNLQRLAPRIDELTQTGKSAPGSAGLVGIRTKDAQTLIGEILFSITGTNADLLVAMNPILRAGAMLGGEQAMTEAADATGLAQPNPFAIQDPNVERAMRRRQIRITDSTATTVKQLRKSMLEAMAQGETTEQIAQRVRAVFNNASNARARMIAMTEVGGIVEDAREEGRKQAGTPLKSWLWSRKETGRDWHMQTEVNTLAEPVATGDLFTLAKTGNRASYPRDTRLPFEDAANCGCTSIARYPGDDVKAVIERYERKAPLQLADIQKKLQAQLQGKPQGETTHA